MSTVPVRNAADLPAHLNDLKAFDAIVDGQSQTLVATVGDIGFALVDPQAGTVRQQGAIAFADGTRIETGEAVAVGRVSDRTLAVVAGAGATGEPAVPANLLGVVDLTRPEAPTVGGFVVLPEAAIDIVLQGDLALVAGQSRTYMVRVGDPLHPFLAGPGFDGLAGRLAFGNEGAAVFSSERSLFGGATAQSGLHSALLRPDAAYQLLKLRTPLVAVDFTQDVLNQTLCGSPGALHFDLFGAAAVTITVDGQPLVAGLANDVALVPIDNVPLGANLANEPHIIRVPTTLFDGRVWEPKSFVIEARSLDDPSHVERYAGSIVPDLRNRAVLPVGHTFVKGVDVLDGHVVRQSTDIRLPGRHLGLEVTRSYSSAAQGLAGDMGAGWSFNWAAAVVPTTCGLYVVSTADGSSQTFRSGDDGRTFTAQKGYHTKLVRNGDGSYDFTDKAGNRHHFRDLVDALSPEKGYRLEYVEEPHGDRARVAYDPLGRVASASEWHPEKGEVRRLAFTWVKAGGFDRVASATAVSLVPAQDLGLRVEFEYDEWGNLLRARRAGTNVSGESGPPRLESYSYTADDDRDRHQLVAATDPNGSRTEFDYYTRTDDFPGEARNKWLGGIYVLGKEEHVKVVREYPVTGPPLTTSFRYDFSQATSGVFLNTVTDARGNETLYKLNSYGAPVQIDEPLGRTTRFEWASDDIYKTRETDALGRETTLRLRRAREPDARDDPHGGPRRGRDELRLRLALQQAHVQEGRGGP